MKHLNIEILSLTGTITEKEMLNDQCIGLLNHIYNMMCHSNNVLNQFDAKIIK